MYGFPMLKMEREFRSFGGRLFIFLMYLGLLCSHSRGQRWGHPLQVPFTIWFGLSFDQVMYLITALLPVHLGTLRVDGPLGFFGKLSRDSFLPSL